ncbi:hypothetical protein DBR06_SOUSAS5210031, partial [Sousa chinensis]
MEPKVYKLSLGAQIWPALARPKPGGQFGKERQNSKEAGKGLMHLSNNMPFFPGIAYDAPWDNLPFSYMSKSTGTSSEDMEKENATLLTEFALSGFSYQ